MKSTLQEREQILAIIHSQREAIKKSFPCRIDILLRAILISKLSYILKSKERVCIIKLFFEFLVELLWCISLLVFAFSFTVIFSYSRGLNDSIQDVYENRMGIYFTLWSISLLLSVGMSYAFFIKDIYYREKINHLQALDEVEFIVSRLSSNKCKQLIIDARNDSVSMYVLIRLCFVRSARVEKYR